MNMKIFRIRRALLLALYEYSGAQDLQTLLCSPKVLLVPSRADVLFKLNEEEAMKRYEHLTKLIAMYSE